MDIIPPPAQENADSSVSVYTLHDPRFPDAIRYVGITIYPDRRQRQHVLAVRKKCTNHRMCWIASLLSDGVEPVLTVIETANENTWEDRERYWIAYYRSIGANLVNSTDGGKGMRLESQQARKEMSERRNGKFLRDMTGEVFEKLTVIVDGGGMARRRIQARCLCGNTSSMPAYTWGMTKSCGRCNPKFARDFVGETYSSLTVVQDGGGVTARTIIVQCVCGNSMDIPVLQWGKNKTCRKCTNGVYVQEGMRFGSLTVVRLHSRPTKDGKAGQRLAECSCDCGGTSSNVPLPRLVSGRRQMCQHCTAQRCAAARIIENKGHLWDCWKKAQSRVRAAFPAGERGSRTNFHAFSEWALSNGYREGYFLNKRDPHQPFTLANSYWSEHRSDWKQDCSAQKYLTVKEAAELKGVNCSSIYGAIRNNRLPATRVSGCTALRESDVHAFEIRSRKLPSGREFHARLKQRLAETKSKEPPA